MDLFIAVTDSDEANLLSTLIVDDALTIQKKIIRLKNDYFAQSHVLSKLGVDNVVFPDSATAQKVKALFDFPKANNVKTFLQCNFKLISIKVQYDDATQYRAIDFMRENVVIVGIERAKSFFIPAESERLEQEDLLYLFGDEARIAEIADTLNTQMPSTIKRVMIFGANALAQKIAKELLAYKLDIKMVDKNILHCKTASELLQDRVTVFNTAFEDHHLFDEEGLKNADILIATGENDEENIVKCIEAKEYGIKKVLAVNNDKAYYQLMHQLGLVVVRGSRTEAYYAILENIASNSIINKRHFCGGRAVLFMRKIYPDSVLIGKEMKRIPIDNVLAFVLREDKIYPLQDDIYRQSDIVTVFGKTEEEDEIEKWIYTL